MALPILVNISFSKCSRVVLRAALRNREPQLTYLCLLGLWPAYPTFNQIL